MATRSYAYQNDYARELVRNAEIEGEIKGELKGEIRLLLDLMEARAFVLSDAQRDQIERCTDSALLRRWAVRAISAKSAAEVLADRPANP